MADAIFYPKELGDVFDRALDRCFERLNAGETESIAFLVIMYLNDEIADQRITIEPEDGRKLPCHVHSSRLGFSSFSFFMYMAGGTRPMAS